jgi:hypothetical protein
VLIGTGFAYYQSQLAQQATHDQLKATYDQIEASKAQISRQSAGSTLTASTINEINTLTELSIRVVSRKW